MVDAVLRAVEQYSMLSAGDSVIVALSGGADFAGTSRLESHDEAAGEWL